MQGTTMPGRERVRSAVACVALALWLLAAGGGHAAAHSSDAQPVVTDAAAGPYRVSVWTAPGVLRTGEIHVETAVTLADGMPVPTSAVSVRFAPVDGAHGAVAARAAAANVESGFRHEAILDVAHGGQYEVSVAVYDAAGRGGVVTFEAQVLHVSAATMGLIYVGVLFTLVWGLWLAKEGVTVWRRQEQRRAGG